MEFGVLGRLLVSTGDCEIEIPAGRHRALLATLLLRPNQVITTGELVTRIWDGQPPRDARATTQTYIRRLRRSLGEGLIITRPGGYLISVHTDQLDLTRFDELLQRARQAGDPAEEAALLAAALGLWRGPALVGVPSEALHRDEVPALTERRLWAVERRVELDLAAGRQDQLVAELRALVAEHPLRERFWVQLMAALAGSGRPAEALQAYEDLRTRLGEELGTDPGTELRDLHRAILRGDPAAAGRLAGSGAAASANGAAHGTGSAARPVVAVATGGRPVTGSAAGRDRAGTGSRAAPALVPPAQLPPDVSAFTGRTTVLRRLDELLPTAGEGSKAVVVVTVEGTAGIGKTALAVHWAHRIRDQFPDGQLYVNLRGYATGEPVRPVAALAGFLHALAGPVEQVPTELAEATARYRSLLADKRMLVVLDNAAHPEQVRPLLPGGGGCLVLVTSRDSLGGLVAKDGAHRLQLDTLPPDEAGELLTHLLGAERVRAEPAAATALADLCGYLPLALRIAAAKLTACPGNRLEAYVAQLRDTDRLAALAVPGDEQNAVRAAFDLSYHRLPEPARRLFRLAGLAPGPDLVADAAAALAGTTPAGAGRLLDELFAAHLLDQPTPGRYALHDLLRHYAGRRAHDEDPAPERQAALERLYGHHLDLADAASRLLYPQKVRLPVPAGTAAAPVVPRFPDRASALSWLDAERANLVATVTHAATHHPPAAWRLADAVRGYFNTRTHVMDGLAVATAALTAAETGNDLAGQAAAQHALANLYNRAGRFDQAIDRLVRAQRLARQTGWVAAQIAMANNLGVIHMDAGALPLAAEMFAEALALEEPADELGPALSNLGTVFLRMGRLAEAASHAARALELSRASGDRTGEAICHAALGGIDHAQGRLPAALDHYRQALGGFQAVGNTTGESEALRDLAALHRDAGRRTEARELAEQAAAVAGGTSNRSLEGACLATLAGLHADPAEAAAGYRRALSLQPEDADPGPRGEVLIGLAGALRLQGEPGSAAGLVDQAIAILGPAGYRPLVGWALTVRAGLSLDAHEPKLALGCAEEAMAIHQETGHRLDEAHTHLVAGQAQLALNHPELATGHWRQAHAILITVATPEVDRVQDLLAGRSTPAAARR